MVSPDGNLTVFLQNAPVDETDGVSDQSLSRDSRFLYVLNSFRGTIDVSAVSLEGGLARLQEVRAHMPSPTVAGRLGLAAS